MVQADACRWDLTDHSAQAIVVQHNQGQFLLSSGLWWKSLQRLVLHKPNVGWPGIGSTPKQHPLL
jgi:hypothetical protein